jgi:hypothetical protein
VRLHSTGRWHDRQQTAESGSSFRSSGRRKRRPAAPVLPTVRAAPPIGQAPHDIITPVTRNVLVTGVGRRRGIGAGIAAGLAKDGWDLTLSYRRPYDERLGLEGQPDDPEQLASELRRAGRRIELIEADLERPSTLTG